ncbi:MAG: sulfite exporter TauE/SafE family protein [Pseudomonadota bacterium]
MIAPLAVPSLLNALPLQSLVGLIAILLLAGVAMGFVSGLLGIGGGGILVPVLYEVFTAIDVEPAIRMHLALGTSLLVILPTSLRGFQTHISQGGVDFSLLKRIAPFIIIGVVFGTAFAARVESWVLKAIWVVFGGALALKMALGRDDWRLGDVLPAAPWPELYCLFVGFVSVLMSIAGASFVVTYLMLYNRPLLPSVSTSSGLGPLVAIPGVLGFMISGWGDVDLPTLSLGYVNLLAAAVIIPASVAMAPVGARMAHVLPKRALELAFAGFLGVVAVRFAINLASG